MQTGSWASWKDPPKEQSACHPAAAIGGKQIHKGWFRQNEDLNLCQLKRQWKTLSYFLSKKAWLITSLILWIFVKLIYNIPEYWTSQYLYQPKTNHNWFLN